MATKKGYFLSKLIGVALTLASSTSFAAAYQIFSPLAYSNPADLVKIHKYEIIYGNAGVFANLRYGGVVNNTPGVSKSDTYTNLPYIRYALRLNKRLVADFDVTSPVLADIKWGVNSLVAPLSTQTNVHGFDFSPKIAFSITKRLAIGAGFDLVYINKAILAFTLGGSLLKNQITTVTPGFDAGIFYSINPKTFIDFSYYSSFNNVGNGTSTLSGGAPATQVRINIPLPAVWTLNLVRILTKRLGMQITVRYLQWNIFQNINIRNSAAGNILIPQDYFNSWYAMLGFRFHYNPKWTFMSGFVWDGNAMPLAYRAVGLPTENFYMLLLGANRQLSKTTTFHLGYGFGFASPRIVTQNALNTARGVMNIYVNTIDASIDFRG